MRCALGLILLLLAGTAWAETEMPLNKVDVATDLPTLERGAETVIYVCTGCHSLKYIHFRDLAKLGIAREKVDEWRGDNPMGAYIHAQMTPDIAEASYGKAPPDLSLINKAREGGANYIYSYLLGYYLTPDGMIGNHYYPPTKMPDVLQAASVTDPAERAQLEKSARDVVSFLSWAADPHAQERKTLGYYVIAYLIFFTTLMFLLKKKIWGKLPPPHPFDPGAENTH